ncbi:Phosphatase [Drechslerella dactyloides]|uniref:Phosphatase n=1 Tax=Drechslerella dactyloides TaxID=74499 RepID=A0AAD6J0R6_DREDA|nr:Phosphatase [Drechslerella dactyloides]
MNTSSPAERDRVFDISRAISPPHTPASRSVHQTDMATSYNIEPQPTGKVLLKTSAGDVEIELWTKECPLACRNFLQLCLDDYYVNTIFHRLVPGFIIQGGDPTGTGHGGEAIYDGGLFADEFNSRLRFNRRGLVGMANSGAKDDNGSQFFFTLGETPELTGKNTMFGRVVGDTIYNVMKMGNLELEAAAGSERPRYPPKILGAEVLVNPFEDVKKREVRVSTAGKEEKKAPVKKKKPKGKQMLSFADGDDGEQEAAPVLPKKKFDPRFVSKPLDVEELPTVQPEPTVALEPVVESPPAPAAKSKKGKRAESSPSPSRSRSPPPEKAALDATKEKIEAVRASLKRRGTPPPDEKAKQKQQPSLLAMQASMLPPTSIPARKRKRGAPTADADYENNLLAAMSSFKSKLAEAAKHPKDDDTTANDPMNIDDDTTKAESGGLDPDADEQNVCDLHFIPNCKSCNWHETAEGQEEDDNDASWMSHTLTFERDRLGKDLTWKRKNEEELVVIDTREKTKEVLQDERRRKEERRGTRTSAFRPDGHRRGDREWDRDRDRDRVRGDRRDRERRSRQNASLSSTLTTPPISLSTSILTTSSAVSAFSAFSATDAADTASGTAVLPPPVEGL